MHRWFTLWRSDITKSSPLIHFIYKLIALSCTNAFFSWKFVKYYLKVIKASEFCIMSNSKIFFLKDRGTISFIFNVICRYNLSRLNLNKVLIASLEALVFWVYNICYTVKVLIELIIIIKSRYICIQIWIIH